ncbi:MAG: phage holin family protein [Candidatus Paceibacterota bacterium]
MIHFLVSLALKIFVPAVTLLLLAQYLSGIEVSGLYIAVIVALILGVLAVTIKPVLFILTLPINIITFGLFSFLLNAIIFWFVSTFVEGFVVDGFLPALLGSAIVSLASTIVHKLSD